MNFKKILSLVAITGIATPVTLSVVACSNKNAKEWDNLEAKYNADLISKLTFKKSIVIPQGEKLNKLYNQDIAFNFVNDSVKRLIKFDSSKYQTVGIINNSTNELITSLDLSQIGDINVTIEFSYDGIRTIFKNPFTIAVRNNPDNDVSNGLSMYNHFNFNINANNQLEIEIINQQLLASIKNEVNNAYQDINLENNFNNWMLTSTILVDEHNVPWTSETIRKNIGTSIQAYFKFTYDGIKSSSLGKVSVNIEFGLFLNLLSFVERQ